MFFRVSRIVGRQISWHYSGAVGIASCLVFLHTYMLRVLLHSRRLMAASIVLLLAVIVALSTASRQPCLEVSSAPWHTWKAGYMTRMEWDDTTSQACPIAYSKTPGEAPRVSLLVLSLNDPYEVILPPQSSILVQSRHLRAPPAVG